MQKACVHCLVVMSFVASAYARPLGPLAPIFHIRPDSGHVNDPNGPFRDPRCLILPHKIKRLATESSVYRTGWVHLFMQYCPYGPCMPQGAPIVPGEVPNYQSAAHFYSADLVHWKWTGNGTGILSGGKEESDTDCPDDHGVYSGSTTIVDGVGISI